MYKTTADKLATGFKAALDQLGKHGGRLMPVSH
jgi:hypothetical protein